MLTPITIVHYLDDTHEIYNGWLDSHNGQVFYIRDTDVLTMSGFTFDKPSNLYDVSDFSKIQLMRVSDVKRFNIDLFYLRMNSTSLYNFLLTFFDRNLDVNLYLERL